MDKGKQRVALVGLGIAFAAYAAVCLIVFEKGPVFWGQLGFTAAAFAFAAAAVVKPPTEKLFMNLPQYMIATIYLAVQVVVGLVFMVLGEACVPWCYVTSILLLAAYLCTMLAAHATAQHLALVDRDVRDQTSFIRNLVLELENMADAAPEDLKPELRKLVEAAKYSNARSCEASVEVEAEITEALEASLTAMQNGDSSSATEALSRIEDLLNKRDRICKTGKI